MRARLRNGANRYFYAALFGLYRALFRAAVPSGPADPGRLRRVLIVRYDRIGDVVVTTPMLEYLKEAAPHAEIDVLASPANRVLLDRDPRVAHVYVWERSWVRRLGLLRRLRGRRYDVVFSVIYGRGLREGLVASLVARPHARRVSVERSVQYEGLFTHVVRTPAEYRHMAEKLLFVARAALGAPTLSPAEQRRRHPMRVEPDPAAEERVDAFLRARALRDFVAVNLAASERWRDWPPAVCAAVLRELLARHEGLAFLLTPPPGRTAEAEEVVRACASPRVRLAPPTPSIHDLVAIVRRARAAITPDTANVHVASACGCPVLVLRSTITTRPELWAPLDVPFRAITADAGQPLSSIPPAAVFAAFESLWDEISATCRR